MQTIGRCAMNTDEVEWMEGEADLKNMPEYLEDVWDQLTLEFCMQKEDVQ